MCYSCLPIEDRCKGFPCLNGGKCSAGDNDFKFKCDCQNNATGDTCDIGKINHAYVHFKTAKLVFNLYLKQCWNVTNQIILTPQTRLRR